MPKRKLPKQPLRTLSNAELESTRGGFCTDIPTEDWLKRLPPPPAL